MQKNISDPHQTFVGVSKTIALGPKEAIDVEEWKAAEGRQHLDSNTVQLQGRKMLQIQFDSDYQKLVFKLHNIF